MIATMINTVEFDDSSDISELVNVEADDKCNRQKDNKTIRCHIPVWQLCLRKVCSKALLVRR